MESMKSAGRWVKPLNRHFCSDHWPDPEEAHFKHMEDLWECKCGRYYKLLPHREEFLFFKGRWEYDWVECASTGDWPVQQSTQTVDNVARSVI